MVTTTAPRNEKWDCGDRSGVEDSKFANKKGEWYAKKNISMQTIRSHNRLAQLDIEARIRLWAMSSALKDSVFYATEQVLGSDGSTFIWQEQLARSWNKRPEEFGVQLYKEWRSLELFLTWLHTTLAFMATSSLQSWISRNEQPLWEFISVNAFIWDIWSPHFQKNVASIIRDYRVRDLERIHIEVLEKPLWDMDSSLFLENIRWLKEKVKFTIVIDDFNLLNEDPRSNISRKLLEKLYPDINTKIKFDWRITWLIAIKDHKVIKMLKELLSRYPWVTIQAEWVRMWYDLRQLREVGVDSFQISSFGWL